jgi:hypothetical protein
MRFVGLFVPNRRWQRSEQFPSLNRTLSLEDLEEFEKGIKLA